MPGGSLTSKPTWSNTFWVFSHVGFFCGFAFARSAASAFSVTTHVGITACQFRRKKSVL